MGTAGSHQLNSYQNFNLLKQINNKQTNKISVPLTTTAKVEESLKWRAKKSYQQDSDQEEWKKDFGWREYLVLSTYWRHAKDKDFSRITTVVSQKHNKELDLVFGQYYFQGDEHHISPKKNPRSQRPFIPTASSTRNSIVEKVKKPVGPSTIYDQVCQESGGMMGAEAVAHTPRNISLIKNVRTKLRRKCNDDDEFSSLLTFTKEKGQSCLRGLQWTPAPRIVYAGD